MTFQPFFTTYPNIKHAHEAQPHPHGSKHLTNTISHKYIILHVANYFQNFLLLFWCISISLELNNVYMILWTYENKHGKHNLYNQRGELSMNSRILTQHTKTKGNLHIFQTITCRTFSRKKKSLWKAHNQFILRLT